MTDAPQPVVYLYLLEPQEHQDRGESIALPTIRVCDRIQPDATQAAIGMDTFEEQYGAITGELPLGGWSGLKRDTRGQLRLVASLRDAAPWLDAATNLVERQLEIALHAGRPWFAFRPLLLVGSPGTGKSHFAMLLAEAAGVGFVQVPMGGDSDNRSLAGTARGWTGTQPALPVVAMVQHRIANPVVILDEIEKVSPERRNGNPHDTLLGMLERRTAGNWYDRCLMAAVDLRHVLWVATANSLDGIPVPLLSRFDVVRVPAPGNRDAVGLVHRLRAEILMEWELADSAIPSFDTGTVTLLARHFIRSGSIRLLRRGGEIALGETIKDVGRLPH